MKRISSGMAAQLAGVDRVNFLLNLSRYYEVVKEIEVGGSSGFGMSEFEAASWLKKGNQLIKVPPLLENVLLDKNELSPLKIEASIA